MSACADVFILLMLHPSSMMFAYAAREDDLPGYREACPHPRDFGSIKRKLFNSGMGAYIDSDEFAQDMRFVFRNGMSYFPPHSIQHIGAKSLAHSFEKLMRKWIFLPSDQNYDIYTDVGDDWLSRELLADKKIMKKTKVGGDSSVHHPSFFSFQREVVTLSESGHDEFDNNEEEEIDAAFASPAFTGYKIPTPTVDICLAEMEKTNEILWHLRSSDPEFWLLEEVSDRSEASEP